MGIWAVGLTASNNGQTAEVVESTRYDLRIMKIVGVALTRRNPRNAWSNGGFGSRHFAFLTVPSHPLGRWTPNATSSSFNGPSSVGGLNSYQLGLDYHGDSDLRGDWRVQVDCDLRRVERHEKGVAHEEVVPISTVVVLPPPSHRIEAEDATVSQFSCRSFPEVRMQRTDVATLGPDEPVWFLASTLLGAAFLNLCEAVQSALELPRRLTGPTDVKTQAMGRIHVAASPSTTRGIWLDEVAESDP